MKLSDAIKEIKEAQGPLTLHLNSNGIGNYGAGLFAEAIRCARIPLILQLYSHSIGNDGKTSLANARDGNFVIDARFCSICTLN